MDEQQLNDLATALIPVIRKAGATVLDIRAKGLQTKLKLDTSPVTTADVESEAIIREALGRISPAIPIIGEEGFLAEQAIAAEPPSYFLVDPIDGTKEFIAGRREFTLNIALVEQGFPTFGIIFAPAVGRLFFGNRQSGAFEEEAGGRLRRLHCGKSCKRTRLIVLVSRSHIDGATKSLTSQLGRHSLRRLGSSLKFALVAADEADIYPRLGPTMAWDSAAGQAIVEAAGGVVLRPDGSRLGYAIANGLRNQGFVAATNQALVMQRLRQPLDSRGNGQPPRMPDSDPGNVAL